MNHRFLTTSLVFASAVLFFASCANTPQGDAATVTAAQEKAAPETGQKFTVDTTASFVRFVGNGVGKNHPGSFKLSNGALSVAGDSVNGGQFTINMTSLAIEEPQDVFQTKLKGHLASADFFDVSRWGTAQFQITNVKPYAQAGADSSVVAGANHLISGNLTLKDVSKNVTFPAKVTVSGNDLTAQANFNIDRTDWGIRYGNDKSLGDKFVSETVNINLQLKAAR